MSLEITVQKFFSTFCPLTSLAPHHCTMMPSLPQTYSKKEVRASSGPLFSLALISWITCPQGFSPALLWFSTSISLLVQYLRVRFIFCVFPCLRFLFIEIKRESNLSKCFSFFFGRSQSLLVQISPCLLKLDC